MKKGNFLRRFAIYMNPIDARYEELRKGIIARNVLDDLTAGLIMAAFTIPLAMGFAIACGLRPEQGIVGGAIAAFVGALFGGSKYHVYGPTAAFIPVIAGLMATYDHGFLVLASLMAGIMLLFSGYLRLGRVIEKIPYSIIVGFTTGVAIIIILSQLAPALGLKEKPDHHPIGQFIFAYRNIDEIRLSELSMTIFTILCCMMSEKMFTNIPGPIFALFCGVLGAKTVWMDRALTLVGDEFSGMAENLFAFTPPALPSMLDSVVALDLFYYAFTFFIIASVESRLCGRIADRLAGNQGYPFQPGKELRGQGMINIFSPLFNGFPHTGAVGRTALNIRIKGRSPVSGLAQAFFTISAAILFAKYLEKIPVACLAGILIYIASGMIRKKEIRRIARLNNYHVVLMCYTAIAVPMIGFVPGILSAAVIYSICYHSFEKKKSSSHEHK